MPQDSSAPLPAPFPPGPSINPERYSDSKASLTNDTWSGVLSPHLLHVTSVRYRKLEIGASETNYVRTSRAVNDDDSILLNIIVVNYLCLFIIWRGGLIFIWGKCLHRGMEPRSYDRHSCRCELGTWQRALFAFNSSHSALSTRSKFCKEPIDSLASFLTIALDRMKSEPP